MKTLTEIIYQYEKANFTWGEFDCCIFTASVVEQYSGKKLPHWREVLTYTNWSEAKKALRKLGCKRLEDLPDIILGEEKADISEAKTGDPVYYINEDGIGVLGVCNGKRAYFLQLDGGLTARDIEDCEFCWSVN